MSNKKEAYLRHSQYYLKVLDKADSLYKQGGDNFFNAIQEFDLNWSNINLGFNRCSSNLEEMNLALLCKDYPDVGAHLLQIRLNAEERIKWRNKSLKAARFANDLRKQASHLVCIGNAYDEMGNTKEAINYYLKATEINQDFEDDSSYINALCNLGIAKLNSGDIAGSIEQLEECLSLLDSGIGFVNRISLPNTPQQPTTIIIDNVLPEFNEGTTLITILLSLSRAYLAKGDSEKAMTLSIQALLNSKKNDFIIGQINALSNLGLIYSVKGNYEKALDSLKEALENVININYVYLELQIRANLGAVMVDAGEFEKGIENFNDSIELAKKIGNKKLEISGLVSLSEAWLMGNKPQKVLEVLSVVLEKAKTANNNKALLRIYNTWAQAFEHLGQIRNAASYYEKQLNLAREVGDKLQEGYALGNIGVVIKNSGNPKLALDYYEEAMIIFDKVGGTKDLAATIGDMGVAYKNLGQLEKAMDCYKTQLKLATELNHRRMIALSLLNIANLNSRLGIYDKVLDYYEQALTIFKEIGSLTEVCDTLNNLGSYFLLMGKLELALSYYEQQLQLAKEINYPKGISLARTNIQILHLKKNRGY